MTQHYDFYGNPINPPKRRGGPASVVWGLVACVTLAVACLIIAFVINRAKPKPEAQAQDKPKGPTHDSMCVTYTYDGEAIRYYVMTDPDTQRQYIVNDRGGMCLREPSETRDEGMRVIRHDDGTVEYIDTKKKDSEEVTE